MKVALIGNMNNNFFSLMRYLRDLGVDAYLLMYKNELAHFTPENDSFDIEKWRPFIREVDIVNGSLTSFFKYTKQHLKKQLEGYDYYIGNGFSPAIFNKAGLDINLYLPYCVGIEYTYVYNKGTILQWLLEPIFAFLQIQGLKKRVKLLGTVDQKAYQKSLNYQIETIPLAMPMVYLEYGYNETNNTVAEIISKMKEYSLVIFSHVSHFSTGSDGHRIKRNDLFIKGFAEYISKTKDHKAKLFFLDYGPGVEDSKKLISDLQISDYVEWLPRMSRKDIMLIIKKVDFGVGEFGGDMWGGTVWEFMAAGIPFFQFVNLNKNEMENLLNAPAPDFFNTNTKEVISDILCDYVKNKDKYLKIGLNLKEWFGLYGGSGLAEEYKKIILSEKNI